MDARNEVKLNAAQIAAINRILTIGERVELIPTKDEVRILKIARRNVKADSTS